MCSHWAAEPPIPAGWPLPIPVALGAKPCLRPLCALGAAAAAAQGPLEISFIASFRCLKCAKRLFVLGLGLSTPAGQ